MADPEKYDTHLFSYRFSGQEYTVDILAKDADEAKNRLKALAWAKYDGVLIARVPQGLGFLARITTAIRNAVFT
jgi:hypothetical protein